MSSLLGEARIRIRPDTQGFEGEAKGHIGKAMAGLAAVMAKGLALTGAAVGAAGAIGVQVASQMEQADIAFTTMLNSGEKAKSFLADLQKFAAQTPFEFPELQTAASSLISVGISADKVIPIMTSLGNATSGMGTGAAGVQRATVAIQQMSAAGRITAEDLNQLRDAGIPVFDLLTAATGKTTEQIAEMAASGKLGRQELDQLMKALESGKGLERFNGLMEKQSHSLAGMFSSLKDTIQLNLAEAVQPFIPALKRAMEAATPVLDSALDAFAAKSKVLIEQVPNLFGAIADKDAQGIGEVLDNMLGNTGAHVATFRGIAEQLIPVGDQIKVLFGNVRDIVHELGPAVGTVLGGGFRLAWEALKLLLPTLVQVTGFLSENKAVLWTLVTAYGAYKAAVLAQNAAMALSAAGGIAQWIKQGKLAQSLTKVWTTIQWAFNAAMSANPIVLVGIAIAALVAGLVVAYQKSEIFRNIVDGAFRAVGAAASWLWNDAIRPAWDAIAAAATWLWSSVLSPVFSAIGTAFSAIATAIQWAWDTIIAPIWNVIMEVAKVLLAVLVVAVFGPILLAWKALSAGIAWAWENVLKPVWSAIEVAAGWLWTNVLQPIFGWIGTQWDNLLTGMQVIWSTVLKPVFDAISTAAGWLWDTILSPIFSAIKAGWDALAAGMKWVWDNVLSPVFGFFGDVLNTLKDSFTTAVDWITRVWDGLKSALMSPVQFVVDAVWNDGLMRLWNVINDLWGGEDLKPFILNAANGAVYEPGSKPMHGAYATGGVLPGYTPGRDVHSFYSPTGGRLNLSGGEAIMRPEFTRAIGSVGIAELNRIARTSGAQGVREALAGNQSFASGGVISLPGWLDPIIGAIPGGGAVKDIIAHINGGTGQGGGHWGQMIGGFISKTASKIWESVQSLFGSSSAPLTGVGGGAEQWRGLVAQVVSMLGLNPSAINGILTMIAHESGGNPNARNDWDSNAMAGHPSQGLMQTIPSTFAAYAGPFISRGILDPLANIYAGVNYALQRYGAAMLESGGRRSSSGGYLGYAAGGVLPKLGIYDTGGLLRSGDVAFNRSGRPERVLNPEQTAAFEAWLKDGGSARRDGDVIVNITVDESKGSARDQVDEVAFQLRRLKRGGALR